ncbi:S-locus lectin protein kinase family protein [Euphorbia peplus]|nr:S-locus lectin protein kinase family protein [Euphorbia peplus]
MQQEDEYDLYVRVDATELAANARKRKKFLKKKGILTISVLSAAVTTIFLMIILAHLWFKKKRTQVKKKGIKERLYKFIANELVENKQPVDLPIFDLGTVSVATENFNPANKLGQGGFGVVYKGELVDGQEIAVKRLSKTSGQGIEELKNEIMLIARLQHRNLVKLLGCCIEGDEQMLIYEFMANKSLDFFIFDEKRRAVMDWKKRFDIIVGIARGMLYLHHDSRLRIIHRDLKLSNVLLDGEMNPKISDFGMARIFKGDGVQNITNRVVGTYGYMAPEYANFGKFSSKSDVFSFGVILLEIISGKKSNDSYHDDPSLNLIGHVWELWREEKAVDVMDSFLNGRSLLHVEVIRCIQIGLLCVEEDADDRPSMASVVVMLNSEATLPRPKQPAFVIRKTSNHPMPSMSPIAAVGSINELTISAVECR